MASQDENVDVLGLLIELVQQYEFLYDLGHRDYKNSKKKDKDRFTREKRVKPSGSEGGESNWVYYERVGFTIDVLDRESKLTHTSLQATTSKATNVGKAYTPCSTSPSSSGWSGIETILSPQSESEPVVEGQETGVLDQTVVPQTTPQTKKGNFPMLS
ncbi:hypothetical protein RI129_000501 [Pyrocoelia pectoralis]|uniref:Uncharacterized protein n=1 Tax=Pyrocoelia pectoralis TaxID=417401 RepID=A0AAN7ZQM6_9COLE